MALNVFMLLCTIATVHTPDLFIILDRDSVLIIITLTLHFPPPCPLAATILLVSMHSTHFIIYLLATFHGTWDLNSLARDWTCAIAVEAQSLNHWTAREASDHLGTSCERNYTVWPFVTGSFHLASWPQTTSMLLHASESCSFYRPNKK